MPVRSAGLIVVVLALASASGAAAADLSLRLDGKILRKASGRLVLSLSDFEVRGRWEVFLQSQKTGETRNLPLSSVYPDISYSSALDPRIYGDLQPDDWVPFVVWTVPRDRESLNRKLNEIQVHQNKLRKELGKALLSEEEPGIKVSSRLTLNKIEKFNRVAARISRELLDLAREQGDFNPFLYPIDVQIGFNPFTVGRGGAVLSSIEQVREVMFWEVHRIYTQQFGIDERIVEFLFDCPGTVRRLVPFGEEEERNSEDFVPTVTLSAESVDAALYMLRQDSDGEVRKLVRIKLFRDPFITERPIIDQIVNVGRVLGVRDRRVAVSFAPPFMKQGETVRVALDADGTETLPIVLESARPVEGLSVSAEIPAEQVARIRPGMTVYRR